MNRESAFVPGVVSVDEDRSVGCGFCQETLYCPSPQICIGCGVCAAGCPPQARTMVADEEPRVTIAVTVDGRSVSVPEPITVKRALEAAGLSFGVGWGEGDILAPCGTGGGYS